MKTIPTLLFALSCVAFSLATSSSRAAIIADFSGGGSKAEPNVADVDAYLGKAGLGWSTAWSPRRIDSAAVVQGGSAVWGNTRRLEVTPDYERDEGGVNRTFAGKEDLVNGSDIDLSKKFTIAFSFSIHDIGAFFNTATNYLYIAQQATFSNNSTTSSIWFLAGFGGSSKGDPVAGFTGAEQGYWNFYEGVRGSGKYVSSGIEILEDALYRFEMEVDPVGKSTNISISMNGDEAVSHRQVFTNISSFPTMLNFNQSIQVGQAAAFSLGDISITQIPEPSTAYLLIGAAGLGLLGLKKVRGQAPKQ